MRWRMVILAALAAVTAAAEPAITGIDPPAAPPGDRVTISGSGLRETTAVRFDDVPAQFVVAPSDTCLIVSVPAGAKSGPVTVVAGGKEAKGIRFRVEPAYWDDHEFPDQLPRPPLQFMRFRQPDGTTIAYFAAGDVYLEAAFAFLDAYWSDRPERSGTPRGHSKLFLTSALKSLGHEPAEVLMRHFASSFFARQNPETNLVAYDPTSWKRFAGEERETEFSGYLAMQVTDHFLRWFPDDPELLARSAALARGIVRHFDACGGGAACGVHSVVDVETGQPLASLARPLDYGVMGFVAADAGRRSGDRSLEEWALRKQDFLWTHRLNPELPLYADTYSPEGITLPGGEAPTSDTDTLYNIRRLYQLYEITGDRRHLERALRVTAFWFERAWRPEWGHFVRKLAPDGTQAVDVLYGDAMYNTLWVLIHAYRHTGRPEYLDRVKLAWRNLVLMGENGLVPRHVQRSGIWVEKGLARNHPNFVEILLEAYEASGDSELLCAAEQYADTILAHPDRALPNAVTRGNAGGALLRLAMTRGAVERLEVRVRRGERLRVESAAGATLLDTVVDGDRAVIYVPAGTYRTYVNGRLRDAE